MTDLRPLKGLDTGTWYAPRWDPAHAHSMLHFNTDWGRGVFLQSTDVDTGATTDLFAFPKAYVNVFLNQSWDEVSLDGRWLSGMVGSSGGAGVIFALDLVAGRLGAVLPIHGLYSGPCTPDPTYGEIWPDWVGVSPLGRSLVVQWPKDGTKRCNGLETFDLSTGAWIGRVSDGHQHGDLGVLRDGQTEFFMTFEIYPPCGPGTAYRTLPGTPTVSAPVCLQHLDWGNMEHISCRGPAGECLVTAGTWQPNGWTAFEGELFVQYTDGRVLRLVHHRSSSCGYWVQPRATISRDGRLAVFASDWAEQTGVDSCGGGHHLGAGDAYLLTVPVRGSG